MVWLLRFIAAHRYSFSLIITVGLSLMLIQSPANRQQEIVRWLEMTLFLPVQVSVDQATRIKITTRENRELREDKTQLLLENSQLRSRLTAQNVADSNLLFQGQFHYSLRPVHIVARDGSSLYRSAVIDAGRSSGIRVNMPVVTHEGVVGKVVTVLEHSSLVSLIRNPNELTSIIDPKTSSVAILSVASNGELFADFLKTSSVAEGDSLFTSGMGGVYPEYLYVGTIKKVYPPLESDLFVKVRVTPAVNFDKLRDAHVIVLDAEWSRYHTEVDSLVEEITHGRN